jgi:protein O-mannosyl-transferase
MDYRDGTSADDTAQSRHGEGVAALLLSRRFFVLLLIALCAVAAYANTFHVPFIFDDRNSIRDNPVIRQLGNFFLNPIGYGSYPTRYVGYLSFALNYRLGGLDVTGYHVVNLAVHICNAFLVYALVLLTFRTPFFRSGKSEVEGRNSERTARNSQPETRNFIALFAALLFAVHPLQTQAVTYIVQRLTSLMSLFYLLAVVLYAWMRVSGDGPRWKGPALYLGSLAAAILAMETKENAFTLPVVIALYEWLFFRGVAGKRILRIIPFLATMLIIPLGMLDLHKPVGAVLSEVGAVTQHKSLLSRPEYLFTEFRVIVTYLRLLVFPAGQNLDYDYPLYRSFFAPPVFLSFLLLAALAGLAVYLTYRSKSSSPGTPDPNSAAASFHSATLRLAAFGIFWFFLTLSVESSVIPITDVIYEHRVYLPSAGAFIAAAALVTTLVGRYAGRTGRKAGLCVAMAVVVVLAYATYQRNKVWHSGISLWEDVVAKSPLKSRGYNNLGAALNDAGRTEEAIAALDRALAINPDHTEAYYNLGRIFLAYPGRIGDAITLLKKAIELDPDYVDAYVNLAAACNKGGKPAEAVKVAEEAIARSPGRPDAHFNLGVAYVLTGNTDGAAREAAVLRRLDPLLAGQLEQYMDRFRAPRG